MRANKIISITAATIAISIVTFGIMLLWAWVTQLIWNYLASELLELPKIDYVFAFVALLLFLLPLAMYKFLGKVYQKILERSKVEFPEPTVPPRLVK